MPKWLAALDKRVAANPDKNFIVGDSLTIADFAMAAAIFSLWYNEANDFYAVLKPAWDSHENLKTYAENLQTTFADYLAARPQPRPF